MENLQSKIVHLKSSNGFTLLELMFTLGIMVMIASIILVNFGGIRTRRNMKIAQSELVSNVEKAKSYSLASRVLPNGKPARFYILKFDRANNPNSYDLQALDVDGHAFDGGAGTNSPNLETLHFPSGITLKSLELQQPSGEVPTYPTCVQVGFLLPYGKMYIDGSCDLINVQQSLATLSTRANSVLTIRLQRNDAPSDERVINIYGISGRIEPE